MKNLHIAISLSIFLLFGKIAFSQNEIKVTKGYSPQIGTTVAMLEDLKARVTNSVQNLNQEQPDFLLDDKANTVGAMIYHLAATEKYYQVYTFENRGYNAKEKEMWKTR